MGHTDHERRRLFLQAQFLNPVTRDFFLRAGIEPGMRVLDLGCGVGDVSLIAARLVGPGGHITGIDIDPHALEIARGRAAAEGLDQVTFEQANVTDYQPGKPLDAVVGRLILVHTQDPVAIVRRAASLLRQGGILALQDCDFRRSITSCPPRPLWDWTVNTISQFMQRVTPHAAVGARLYRIFTEVGMSVPQCRGECVFEGAPDNQMFEWVSETVRSLLPGMEKLGLAKAAEVDIDTLASRLRAETEASGECTVGPMLIGAFARKL